MFFIGVRSFIALAVAELVAKERMLAAHLLKKTQNKVALEGGKNSEILRKIENKSVRRYNIAIARPTYCLRDSMNALTARRILEGKIVSFVPRPLTSGELALYSRLAEVLQPQEAAIVREQLEAATILDSGKGHARFYINRPVRPLRFEQSQAFSGTYNDTDGWPIDIIVHAASGLLDSVERYRTDARLILRDDLPAASDIYLMPSKDQPTPNTFKL